MKDFFKFKKMIAPIIIPILFLIGTVFCVITGIVFIIMGTVGEFRPNGGETVLLGLAYIFIGPIIMRVYCEFLIILFSVNDKLTDIKDLLKSQQDKDNQTSVSNDVKL